MSSEPEITFYHAPQSRAVIVHWMLEEIGAPYRMHLLNLKTDEHKAPAYLAVNPMGKVPALAHGDVVIGSTLWWGTVTKALPERPEIAAYAGRLKDRPALQRAFARDAELVAALGD
jgi:glutathione S-transferase